ncbi:MAG: hypothetical protein ACI8PG_004497, partial [Planctomycetota bacterium]
MSFRFKGKPMLRAILLVGACALSADAAEWVLGGSGLSWGDVVEVRAQIDDQSSPGSIQIRGFTPDENIINSLNW